MNLTISGHHLMVTVALHDYVLEKLNPVRRHSDEVVDANVTLTFEKHKEKEDRHTAQVTLRFRGKEILARQSHQDMYAAIEKVMDKLDRQLVRQKELGSNHLRIISLKRLEVSAHPL